MESESRNVSGKESGNGGSGNGSGNVCKNWKKVEKWRKSGKESGHVEVENVEVEMETVEVEVKKEEEMNVLSTSSNNKIFSPIHRTHIE